MQRGIDWWVICLFYLSHSHLIVSLVVEECRIGMKSHAY